VVVIAAHRFHRRHLPQLRERFLSIDVARVKDQVDPAENLQDARRQLIEELGAVRIGNDPDASR
jgi:hypothetical protein